MWILASSTTSGIDLTIYWRQYFAITNISSPLANLDPPARQLGLLVAASCGPVSLDLVAGSGRWRPAALLGALDTLRSASVIVVDDTSDQIAWVGDRDLAVLGAAPGDVDALMPHPPCLALLLAGARQAATAGRFPAASVLYHALARVPADHRETFPGGVADWLDLMIEGVRLFRSAWTLEAPLIEAGMAQAEAAGKLEALSVLCAVRGVRAIADSLPRARRYFDRALEAAEALADPRVHVEAHATLAVSLGLAGRPAEAIAAFESLCGNVQDDLLGAHWGTILDLDGALPGSALSQLAYAYALTGNHARALDLMGRLVALGATTERQALEAQGQVMLGLVCMLAGDEEGAARASDTAAPRFSTLASPYSWVCALTRAWVRRASNPTEARSILVDAVPAWFRTGRYWIGGSVCLELLASLESSTGMVIDGLSVTEEIARHLDVAQPFLSGVAHRWAARQAPLAEKRQHLARSVAALREAGAGPELALALADTQHVEADADHASNRAAPAPRPASTSLVAAVIDLGRLDRHGPLEHIWGSLAARLCHTFGAERCAVVIDDERGRPMVKGARGSTPWYESVMTRLALSWPVNVAFEAARAPGVFGRAGTLVLVPFDASAGRRGLVAIENADTPLAFNAEDTALTSLLAQQLTVFAANAAMAREWHVARQHLEQENRSYREQPLSHALGSGRIVGHSPAMGTVLELVHRVAPTTVPVLILGESGVGKELVAHEVHQASTRRARPLITVNIAALSPGLVASTLFGHERGAFTGATERVRGVFELADGGTLFLDEVGELSAEDQVRLLRVLQEGTFERVGSTRPQRSDFRLVAATNRDLQAAVRDGRFREDLYFRLAAFPITVPPLRDRCDEIPALALHFLAQSCRQLGRRFDGITEADVSRLVSYHWPGNVRELMHVIERAVLLSDPPTLRVPDLAAGFAGLAMTPGKPGSLSPVWPPSALEGLPSLEDVERQHVRRVLQHVGGRVSGEGSAAEILRIKPTTLHFWIDRLGLRDELAELRRARRRIAPTSRS